LIAGGVHHVALVVEDLGRAERFWCGVLGLTVERRWQDEQGRPRSIWVRLDERAFLALELATADGPKRPPALSPGWHCVVLGIRPSERALWRARLCDAGHAPERESEFTIYTRDPEGNLLGLSHWPEPEHAEVDPAGLAR
jgi:catechol 2,3-dioxygenase-like lactoylglutathione lyase family enzyme